MFWVDSDEFYEKPFETGEDGIDTEQESGGGAVAARGGGVKAVVRAGSLQSPAQATENQEEGEADNGFIQ